MGMSPKRLYDHGSRLGRHDEVSVGPCGVMGSGVGSMCAVCCANSQR